VDLLPAIDLRQGRVVRLRQGDDAQRTVYGEDPAAVLEAFATAGARWVHVVDLDAAFGEAPQRPLLTALIARAAALGLKVELGGGLRDRRAVQWARDAGCARGVVGSMVAKQTAAFLALVEEFPNWIVPGLDFKEGRLAVSGWTEVSHLNVEALGTLLRDRACPAVLVTDVARDGLMTGPNFDLATAVAEATGIPALLSGGIHSLEDLRQAATTPQIAGAVVGRALYDGSFSLAEALAACAHA
jgi:phosphoribosylformimino-5-aminoimidazole carboxamide ribotide isomerase